MDSGYYVRDQGALVELSASECALRELPPDGLTFPTSEVYCFPISDMFAN